MLRFFKVVTLCLYCAAIFINLAKAFDSVIHHILIGRLNSLGFSSDCLAWFTNYFSDRVQCQIGGPVLRTSGSLYGGATGFNSRTDSSLYTSLLLLVIL